MWGAKFVCRDIAAASADARPDGASGGKPLICIGVRLAATCRLTTPRQRSTGLVSIQRTTIKVLFCASI